MHNGKYVSPSTNRARKGRKRAGLVTLSLLLLLIFTISGTLAFIVANTDSVKNSFTPAEITCEVTEVFTDGVHKENVNVINTGNTDAWVRLKLVSYWVNAQGQIVGGTAEIPSFTLGDGWAFKADDTAGTGYYYYTSPVAPNSKPAADLLSYIELQVKTETTIETDAEGNQTTSTVIVEKQVIEVIAEAIQSKPDQAVKDAWGFVPGK